MTVRSMVEWTTWLSEPFRGRKVILGYWVLAGTLPALEQLRDSGAQTPLIISTADGTGTLPGPDDAIVVRLAMRAHEDMTSDVRSSIALAASPPAAVVDAVEAYDPEREAIWLVQSFSPNTPILGRPVIGGRPASWGALEDKTICDEIFDQAEVPRAPSVVVAVGDAVAAAQGVDRGAGTVWGGDARDGLNGGSDFVRWVTSAEQAAPAVRFFVPRCDRVRVMPYLPGLPCSIHGFVLPDGTASFRPLEMVQLVDRTVGRFEYCGMSTWWDPPVDVRADMRATARRVGEVLRDRVDYRGGFSVDGVAGPAGFRPTEINPRFSGGLVTMARALEDFPLTLVQHNVVLGRDARIDAAELESIVTESADDHRRGTVMAIRKGEVPDETREIPIRFDHGMIAATEPEDAQATLSVGPHSTGTFLRVPLDERTMTAGESAVPYAQALSRFDPA